MFVKTLFVVIMERKGSLQRSQVLISCLFSVTSFQKNSSKPEACITLCNMLYTEADRPLLMCCPWSLLKYIHYYPVHAGCLLHPQPEDMPCHGKNGPIQHWRLYYHSNIYVGCTTMYFLTNWIIDCGMKLVYLMGFSLYEGHSESFTPHFSFSIKL